MATAAEIRRQMARHEAVRIAGETVMPPTLPVMPPTLPLIDPPPVPVEVTLHRPPGPVRFVLVGAGGTGARVGMLLPRMVRSGDEVIVCDPDVVEGRNLLRQHFLPGDIGRHKAEVIAGRIRASIPPSTGEIAVTGVPLTFKQAGTVIQGEQLGVRLSTLVILGCVDTPTARREIAECPGMRLWIDAGNGYRNGQVILNAYQWPGTLNTPWVKFLDIHWTKSTGGMPIPEGGIKRKVTFHGIKSLAPELLEAGSGEGVEACGIRIDTQTIGANAMAATLMGTMLASILDELPMIGGRTEFCTSPAQVTTTPWAVPSTLKYWGEHTQTVILSPGGKR